MKNQYDSVGKGYIAGVHKFFRTRKDSSLDYLVNEVRARGLKKKILDLGCGGGHVILALKKIGTKNVYGIDQSKLMLDEAINAGVDKRRLVHGSIDKMKFRSKEFDIVISRFAIQHLKSLRQVHKEVFRILKPGGSFIFAVPHPFSDLFYLKSREYGKEEAFTFELFKGVKITNYSHPFSKYISKEFLSLFDLKIIAEGQDRLLIHDGFKSPDFLCIHAIKRHPRK